MTFNHLNHFLNEPYFLLQKIQIFQKSKPINKYCLDHQFHPTPQNYPN